MATRSVSFMTRGGYFAPRAPEQPSTEGTLPASGDGGKAFVLSATPLSNEAFPQPAPESASDLEIV